jgi:hypothetical protein
MERKQHIEREHASYVGQLYHGLGGFWTAMIVATKEIRLLPTLEHIFPDDGRYQIEPESEAHMLR